MAERTMHQCKSTIKLTISSWVLVSYMHVYQHDGKRTWYAHFCLRQHFLLLKYVRSKMGVNTAHVHCTTFD